MPVYFPGSGLPGGVKPVGVKTLPWLVRALGSDGSVFSLDRLGPSFVDIVGAANPNDGTMKVRVSGYVSGYFSTMIEAAIPIAGGKHIVHQLGKELQDGFFRHYSAFIADKTVEEKWHPSNGMVNETEVINIAVSGAAWTNSAGQNPYTSVVGTQLTFAFSGTGLDIKTYCDNRGGAWSVEVDGVPRGSFSTWREAGQYAVAPVVRGLSDGNHTAVMTFLGSDGVNAPAGGVPARGWTTFANTATPTGDELRTYGMVRVVRVADVYTKVHQLAAPGSNMEAAIRMRKAGSPVVYNFWPFHSGVAGSTTIVSSVVYIDGKVVDTSVSSAKYITAFRVDVAQSFTVCNPAEPAVKLADGLMLATMTADGYEYQLELKLAESVEIDAAYGPMCAAHNCDRIEWASGQVQSTAAHNGAVYTPSVVSDSGLLSDPSHPYVWAYEIFDWKKTMRVGRVGSIPAWAKVEARTGAAERMTKSYNYITPNGAATILPAGEVITAKARYRGGVLSR